jgi:hypothetical protein
MAAALRARGERRVGLSQPCAGIRVFIAPHSMLRVPGHFIVNEEGAESVSSPDGSKPS